MEGLAEIYIYLLDEGTDAWRPVQAVHVSGDVYRILSRNPDPEQERREFDSGESVRCKECNMDDDPYLVAYERA